MAQTLPTIYQIALLCGGPSDERGVSLNSARSILDHLDIPECQITPFYLDRKASAWYRLSRGQLYSNTPDDFAFRMTNQEDHYTFDALALELQKYTLVFPAIHGSFGEDGTLQKWLEDHQLPYVGSPAKACSQGFPKNRFYEILHELNLPTAPHCHLFLEAHIKEKIAHFLEACPASKYVMRPTRSGSSLGIRIFAIGQNIIEEIHEILSEQHFSSYLLEPFHQGREFTICVLQSHTGIATALIPTQIEILKKDEIYDYRKKYLPSAQVAYHTPPEWPQEIIDAIGTQAEMIFNFLGCADLLRMDGWYLNDGTLIFTDFNPVSGFEQTSLLMQQAMKCGFTHTSLLVYLLQSAARRHDLSPLHFEPTHHLSERLPVHILMGGTTAEKEVSHLSGTNVWLKLFNSESFIPYIYLFMSEYEVWRLPYAYPLHHTVDEIRMACIYAEKNAVRLHPYRIKINDKLNHCPLEEVLPERITLHSLCNQIAEKKQVLFSALHGGVGENGTLQKIYEKYKIPYNGAGAKTSALCMDKYFTRRRISDLKMPRILLPRQQVLLANDLEGIARESEGFWQELIKFAPAPYGWIIKPRSDGCSAGIVRIHTPVDLRNYIAAFLKGDELLAPGTCSTQAQVVEMPKRLYMAQEIDFLLEPYVQTDKLVISESKVTLVPFEGWIELTMAFLPLNNNELVALPPSVTVATGDYLNVEEKFQGGTGVNLTPPPEEIISAQLIRETQKILLDVAVELNILNYARVDFFLNRLTQEIIIIEFNTLPALTPSTVLFQQAMSYDPALTPRKVLQTIIQDSYQRQLAEKLFV